ncbi:E3 ubiquitin-protein ligase TRIM21-like [Lissotriton helveticus]
MWFLKCKIQVFQIPKKLDYMEVLANGKTRSFYEAAQGYKETLSTHLGRLQEELEKLQTWEAEQRRTAADLEGNFKDQTKMIQRTFELLKQFLDKEEQQLLRELEKKHQQCMKKIQGKVTELEQSTRRDLIKEIEEKCQQEYVHLMKGVQSILNRCTNMKKIQKPEEGTVAGESVQSFGKHAPLQKKLLELKETFRTELEWRYVQSCASAVTLDPDTAHRGLILSEAGRSLRLGDRIQDLPDTPQRFYPAVAVLGRERLSSGRHYWEVEVGHKTAWDLGVCDEAANRKGKITLTPAGGFWIVWLRYGKYEANTSPYTLLTPRAPPRAVGLLLDYEAGRLSVYNVDDRSLLFTFSGASFAPTLRPYFSPGGRNAGTLRILQETWLCEPSFAQGYLNYSVPATKGPKGRPMGGLTIWVQQSMSLTVKVVDVGSKDIHCIKVDMGPRGRLDIYNVYARGNQCGRSEVLAALGSLLETYSQDNIIIAGDLNCTFEPLAICDDFAGEEEDRQWGGPQTRTESCHSMVRRYYLLKCNLSRKGVKGNKREDQERQGGGMHL